MIEPEKLPQTSVVDLLQAVLKEVVRLRDSSTLFVNSADHSAFLAEARSKIDSIDRATDVRMAYHDHINEVQTFATRVNQVTTRPTYNIGLAPW